MVSTVPFQVPWMRIGVSRFLDRTYAKPITMPSAISCGKSLPDRWALANRPVRSHNERLHHRCNSHWRVEASAGSSHLRHCIRGNRECSLVSCLH